MGSRALVTGASGFVGSHLVRALLGSNFEVTVLLRPGANAWRLSDIIHHLRVVRADLTDYPAVLAGVRKAAPDLVFHLAWAGVTGRSRERDELIRANLVGSVNILLASVAAGVAGWVGVGSQAEYEPGGGVVSEKMSVGPNTVYGSTKASVYFLSRAVCRKHGLRFTWLRLFAAYGPADSPDYLVPYIILRLLRGLPAQLTAGEQKWDYLYVEDAAEAIVLAGLRAEGTYNLGAGVAYPVRAIANEIGFILGAPHLIQLGTRVYGANQVMHLQADISALQQATGWAPRTRLRDGLEATVRWFKDNLHRYPPEVE